MVHACQVFLTVHVGPLLKVAANSVVRLLYPRYPANAQGVRPFSNLDDARVAEEVDVLRDKTSIVQVSQKV